MRCRWSEPSASRAATTRRFRARSASECLGVGAQGNHARAAITGLKLGLNGMPFMASSRPALDQHLAIARDRSEHFVRRVRRCHRKRRATAVLQV
jgi:hypothetical protein